MMPNTEAILRNMFEGNKLEKIASSGAYFSLEFLNSGKHDCFRNYHPPYLHLSTEWAIFDSVPETIRNSKSPEVVKMLPVAEQFMGLYDLFDVPVVGVELIPKRSHLLLTFENNKTLFVHGYDQYECWSTGVVHRQESGNFFWLITLPDGDTTVMASDEQFWKTLQTLK